MQETKAMHNYSGPHAELWDVGVCSLRELEAERGILASGRDEVYGCVFGRDSLITSLTLLDLYDKTEDTYFLDLVRKVLLNLGELQGREVNIESGEEPGKMIHEYRPEKHEHLTAHPENPWYVYEDNVMRNYDTVDATPLFLMTVHRYYRATGDRAFVDALMLNVRAALSWLEEYGDSNGDGFIDYRFHPDRKSGGLVTQSWMDSGESVFFEENTDQAQYPIAPVEVQAYTYAAFRAWADFFMGDDAILSSRLSGRADTLKKKFNAAFVVEGKRGKSSLAFAIDGCGRQLISPRSSMGHVLWAAWKPELGAMPDSVLDEQYIPAIARRLLAPDLYIPRAGIRTLSVRSRAYDAESYHNGSIWPHDTSICADGLENFGFREEAKRVRASLVSAYRHFNTPLELFVYSGGKYREYCGPSGQGACRKQAWSVASLLTVLHETN
jgi:glycogen debranching enzyme